MYLNGFNGAKNEDYGVFFMVINVLRVAMISLFIIGIYLIFKGDFNAAEHSLIISVLASLQIQIREGDLK